MEFDILRQRPTAFRVYGTFNQRSVSEASQSAKQQNSVRQRVDLSVAINVKQLLHFISAKKRLNDSSI